MRNFFLCAAVFSLSLGISSCGDINSIPDPHFTEDGYYLADTTEHKLILEQPCSIKFFVEVSGSMNGFFRANKPTYFKSDVWQILSYYSPIAKDVTLLTNDGNSGAIIDMNSFQNQMNTGAFISQASTKVPVMIETILSNLNTENGEVAVLISDMKYSPVGSAAPKVLLTQYSTDISTILGKYQKSVSLICATSNYLDKSGNELCNRSPYYFLILGKANHVISVRNGISTLLQDRGHFIDNIESGIDYGSQSYSFGMSNRCNQLFNEPTFVDYEEPDVEYGDTCTIKLKVDLTKYRWLLENESIFRNSFSITPTYGSKVNVGNISYDINTKKNNQLEREAIANVELKVFNMATDSEVLVWKLNLPDTNYTLFYEFFDGAINENDVSKSYSVNDFVKGMFYGGVLNTNPSENYILVSKNY
ncbi:MAG: hypothetical protein IJN66_01025 [Muribaculaceae bacterium]|nr:hypothetical protein [Muribaculaceae bacterium]